MLEDKKPEKCTNPQKVLLNHRMHRSSVRPFFCCGSQVSLNSISESKDLADSGNKTDDDYEDLTDSDDTENFEFVSKPDRLVQRLSKGSNSKRKKYGLKLLDKQIARNKFWRLRGKLQVARYQSEKDECSLAKDISGCVCTSLKKDSGESLKLDEATGGVPEQKDPDVASPLTMLANVVPPPSQVKEGKTGKGKGKSKSNGTKKETPLPFINLNKLYPINDIDQQRIEHRRREMELGVDVPAGESDTVWIHKSEAEEETSQVNDSDASVALIPSRNSPSVGQYPSYGAMGLLSPQADIPQTKSREYSDEDMVTTSTISLNSCPWLPMLMLPAGVHTQVDYKHYLVPNLDDIVRSSFYWGVMDRYEAERLIDKKPEGTFLLRDSAQDDFLFSVSFRRYGRSLHARIEQWNHNFSFDSRDPGVFATDSVCGLIEHYKDPSSCMFFEPMLTQPLHRSSPFSLQHLARATICSNTTYDGVSQLTLPRSLKDYLRCYHYKQKVRVRRFENNVA